MLNDQRKGFQPLFLCGYPRSGTTLLLSLLDAHPNLCVFPEETDFQSHLDSQSVFRTLTDGETVIKEWFEKPTIQSMFQKNNERDNQLKVGGVGMTNYDAFDQDTLADLFIKHFNNSPKQIKDQFESLLYAYNEYVEGGEKKYYVEKQPGNEHRLFKFLEIWDNTKAVFIVRHPLAAVISKMQKGTEKVQSILNDELNDHEFVRQLKRWVNSYHQVYQFAQVHPEKLLIVKYEDLLNQRQYQMERISNFLSIPFHENTLTPTKGGELWKGVSSTLKHTDINYSNNNERWTKILSTDQVNLANLIVGHMAFLLGYTPIMPTYKQNNPSCDLTISTTKSLTRAYKYLPIGMWIKFTKVLFFSGIKLTYFMRRWKIAFKRK